MVDSIDDAVSGPAVDKDVDVIFAEVQSDVILICEPNKELVEKLCAVTPPVREILVAVMTDPMRDDEDTAIDVTLEAVMPPAEILSVIRCVVVSLSLYVSEMLIAIELRFSLSSVSALTVSISI